MFLILRRKGVGFSRSANVRQTSIRHCAIAKRSSRYRRNSPLGSSTEAVHHGMTRKAAPRARRNSSRWAAVASVLAGRPSKLPSSVCGKCSVYLETAEALRRGVFIYAMYAAANVPERPEVDTEQGAGIPLRSRRPRHSGGHSRPRLRPSKNLSW